MSIVLGCCERVSVQYTEENDFVKQHSKIYTTYRMEDEKYHGRNYYTSEESGNSSLAIAWCNSPYAHWMIIDEGER